MLQKAFGYNALNQSKTFLRYMPKFAMARGFKIIAHLTSIAE